MRLTAAIGLAALLLAAWPALAQDSSSEAPASSEEPSTVPEELQGMVGSWLLAQEDESLPTCAVDFTDQQSIGGWAVEVPDPCPAPYPAADSIMTWNVDTTDGSVLLMDAERHVVLRLFEDEDGLFDTDPATEPRFYLLPPGDDEGTGGENDTAE